MNLGEVDFKWRKYSEEKRYTYFLAFKGFI